PPGVQLRIDDLFVVASFLVGHTVLTAHSDRAAGAAQDVDETDLLDAQIIPPELPIPAGPGAEVEPGVSVLQAVEDEIVVRPILRPLGAKGLPAHRALAVGREHLDLGIGGSQVLSLHPERDAVLAMRLKLERLGETTVAVLILADALHA